MTSANITHYTEGGQRQQKMTEWESHRQTQRERGAPVSLVTPVGNHTLHPMAPDTHTLSHTKANDMLGNVVRGKPEKGKTERRRKTITRTTKKDGRPVSLSLFLLLHLILSESLCPCVLFTHLNIKFNLNISQEWPVLALKLSPAQCLPSLMGPVSLTVCCN